MRKFALALFAVLGCAALAGCNEDENGHEKVLGSVHIAPGQHADSADTVNGSVEIGANAVVKHAETVNGKIDLDSAHVGGGIDSTNSNLTVGPGSRIEGGIHYKASKGSWINFGNSSVPEIVIGPDATVKGTMHFERDVKLYVSDRATIEGVDGATAQKFTGDRP